MDDVTVMIAEQFGQILPIDEETSDQFQQLMKKIMRQANGLPNEE